ncbi:unnamed protein product [Mycena citricolor]|uniref:Uncharacterized protein n=1 Tax=Mycena citricolor TaxID=2018698 RepID=A0AAD2HUG5_9AGAR|nr:unnamed protein product [Mycena citricolor]
MDSRAAPMHLPIPRTPPPAISPAQLGTPAADWAENTTAILGGTREALPQCATPDPQFPGAYPGDGEDDARDETGEMFREAARALLPVGLAEYLGVSEEPAAKPEPAELQASASQTFDTPLPTPDVLSPLLPPAPAPSRQQTSASVITTASSPSAVGGMYSEASSMFSSSGTLSVDEGYALLGSTSTLATSQAEQNGDRALQGGVDDFHGGPVPIGSAPFTPIPPVEHEGQYFPLTVSPESVTTVTPAVSGDRTNEHEDGGSTNQAVFTKHGGVHVSPPDASHTVLLNEAEEKELDSVTALNDEKMGEDMNADALSPLIPVPSVSRKGVDTSAAEQDAPGSEVEDGRDEMEGSPGAHRKITKRRSRFVEKMKVLGEKIQLGSH